MNTDEYVLIDIPVPVLKATIQALATPEDIEFFINSLCDTLSSRVKSAIYSEIRSKGWIKDDDINEGE